MEVRDYHQQIVTQAIAVANRAERPEELAAVEGQIFFEASNRTGKLTLGIPDGLLQGIPEESHDAVIKWLQQTARNAVMQALIEQKEIFGGLIVGAARNGNNYFGMFE